MIQAVGGFFFNRPTTAAALVLAAFASLADTLRIDSVVDVADYSATIQGFLAQPEGDGPFPAVILMHGCGGLNDVTRRSLERHSGYLVSLGYSTLILDSFGPRGKGGDTVCASQLELNQARHYRPFDAYHALQFLQSQPSVDGENVFLMGQSQGGSVALIAAVGPFDPPFPSTARFRAIVAYYPWCGVLPTWPMKIASPLLVLGAGNDDWVSPDYCLHSKDSVDGAPYEVVVYDKALHGFDIPMPTQKYLGYTLGEDPAAFEDSQRRMSDWFKTYRQ